MDTMDLRDQLRKLFGVSDTATQPVLEDIEYSFSDRNGQDTWFLLTAIQQRKLEQTPLEYAAGYQKLILETMCEEGLAQPVSHGFQVSNQALMKLETDLRMSLGLPGVCTGEFKAEFTAVTTSPHFDVQFSVLLDGFKQELKLDGPLVALSGGKTFSVDEALGHALIARDTYQLHSKMNGHDEVSAVQLVYDLKVAQQLGLSVDLGVYEKFTLSTVSRVGVDVHENPTGGLRLKAKIKDLDPDLVSLRLHQAPADAERAVIRVADEFVMLEKNAIQGIHEVMNSEIVSQQNASSKHRALS
jgi:hypothetical protein